MHGLGEPDVQFLDRRLPGCQLSFQAAHETQQARGTERMAAAKMELGENEEALADHPHLAPGDKPLDDVTADRVRGFDVSANQVKIGEVE